MDEKAVVEIGTEGNVTSCPMGDPGDCGYKGGKVCGKCGAMSVQKKSVDDENSPEEEEETLMEEVDEKGAMMMRAIPGKDEVPDAEIPARSAVANPGRKRGENLADMEDPASTVTSDESDPGEISEVDESAVAEDPEMAMKRRRDARARRLAMMGGMKTAEGIEDDAAYICGLQKKVLTGGSTPCAGCVGGCAPEGNLPNLVEVEGLALEEHAGVKVLDSGYSDTADMFLVDVMQKDGRIVEVIYEGDTAECVSWKRLNVGPMSEKSAGVAPVVVVGFDAAADIAVKSIGGKVTEITSGAVDNREVYMVEIKTDDGEDHTVIVATDGEIVDSAVEAGLESKAAPSVEIKASDDPEFLASLMEFEVIEVETEINES